MVESFISLYTFINAFPGTHGRTFELFGEEKIKQVTDKILCDLDSLSKHTNKIVPILEKQFK